MEGYIVIGILVLACAFMGFYIYRSSRESGGCGCSACSLRHLHEEQDQ